MRKSRVIACAAILLAACAGDKQSASRPEAIRIAAILSLSGRYSAIDVPTSEAIQLWVDSVNASGRLVDYQLVDAGSDGIRAVERLESLWAKQPTPEILLLSTSSIAMAVAPHLREKSTLVIANAGHPNLIGSSNFFTFSTFPDLHDECGLFVERLRHVSAQKLFIVNAGDVYHQANAALLKQQFGGQIVGEEQYQEGTADFSQIVSAIVRANPDAVALFGFGLSYPAFTVELARQQFRGQLLVDSDYLYNDTRAYPPELRIRTTFVAPTSVGKPTAFHDAFHRKYKKPMPYFASFIVDGLDLAVEAARNTDRTPEKMTEYLQGVAGREMRSGPVSVGNDHRFSYRLALYIPTETGFEHLTLPRR